MIRGFGPPPRKVVSRARGWTPQTETRTPAPSPCGRNGATVPAARRSRKSSSHRIVLGVSSASVPRPFLLVPGRSLSSSGASPPSCSGVESRYIARSTIARSCYVTRIPRSGVGRRSSSRPVACRRSRARATPGAPSPPRTRRWVRRPSLGSCRCISPCRSRTTGSTRSAVASFARATTRFGTRTRTRIAASAIPVRTRTPRYYVVFAFALVPTRSSDRPCRSRRRRPSPGTSCTAAPSLYGFVVFSERRGLGGWVSVSRPWFEPKTPRCVFFMAD